MRGDTTLRAAARGIINEPDVDREKLLASGEQLMLALYKDTTARTMDELRNFLFHEMASDPKRRHKLAGVDRAVMPFTSNACRMKSLRSYLQVQRWLRPELSPLDYGWSGKT